jgi:hypothetical protein
LHARYFFTTHVSLVRPVAAAVTVTSPLLAGRVYVALSVVSELADGIARLPVLHEPLAGLRVRFTVRVVPLFGLRKASYAVTFVVNVPLPPTVIEPDAQLGVELENCSCVAAPATTVTDAEPEIVPSVAPRVAVSAAFKVTEAVPVPLTNVTLAG